MYKQYFNLKQSPFSIAPDPRYLFMSERHREALAHLLYGIGSGGGFVLLTGEIGAGKTTVCRCFMEQIPDNCRLAYIFNPKLSVEELLLSICDEFRIALAPSAAGTVSVKTYVDAINGYLLASHAEGKNNVLVIDEAQKLSARVLEQLRLLTNLETSERKLLQIILIGQPELRQLLAHPELEQLAQRVIARYHLGPLSQDETGSYITHRLAVSGLTGPMPFPPRLVPQIHELSKGIPRRINLLCDRALLGAYVENLHQVSRRILDKSAREVFAKAERFKSDSRQKWPYVLGGVLAGAVASGAAVWFFMPHTGTPAALALSGKVAPVAVALTPAKAPEAQLASPASLSAALVAASGQAVAPASRAVAAAGAAASVPAAAPASAHLAESGIAETLHELASLWGVKLPDGDPCEAAMRVNLRCYQSKGGIDELRLLDRPAMLSVHGEQQPRTYVLLTALRDNVATLRVADKELDVSVAALSTRFDGEFITLWKAPRTWREQVGPGDKGAEVDWLAKQLAKRSGKAKPAGNQSLDGATGQLLREFQASQQIKADGVAGPQTFIRLVPLAGRKEPRLSGPAPAAQIVAGK